MISLIICARSSQMSVAMKHNIADTIGNVTYELVWIDNSSNRYSIYEAYNEGVRQAHYPYLCFMHEDIVFRSLNWGNRMIEVLQEPATAITGVIGGCFIGKTSLSWYMPGCVSGKVIQGCTLKGHYSTYVEKFADITQHDTVACVDGLWIGSRKELFDNGMLRWDDRTFFGFHLYDFDICMQANVRGYLVKLCRDVDIEHTSLGTKTADFYDAVLLFHKKWDSQLPVVARGCHLPDAFDESLVLLEEYCTLAKQNFKRIQTLSHWSHKLVSAVMRKK